MKPRVIALLCVGALAVIGATGTCNAELLELSDAFQTEENAYGDATYAQPIELGRGVTVMARTEITRKGNGVLSVKNLELRVYDAHNDAAYFENDLLKTEFVDVDGDGMKDLVVSGIVVYEVTHVGRETRFVREPVVFIYLYRSNGGVFKLAYKSASFDLDPGSGPTQSPHYLDQGTWQQPKASGTGRAADVDVPSSKPTR